ncbi:glycoside hydrolase family 66 protein [Flavihumibacter sp. UBA7668]|uniref:glycoside hydrolase family 66 protein n=1 Tax=Flavihumibacter sp. UBA7668 TaxID=1946542 RepID=UPI0025C4D9B5|nr:glycoside hydrolase family 66 protein [Flavihumibacter sp. UBA7668]
MVRLLFLVPFLAVYLLTSCKKDKPSNDPITYGSSFALNLFAEKAVYKPGETVRFSINRNLQGDWKVRLRHLNSLILEQPVSGNSVSIALPAQDFKGYLVELVEIKEGKEIIQASIGVDVSSDWHRFPRYGFLSKFGAIREMEMEKTMEQLTRHHINGLQFYDWQYKHHQPLAGTGALPMQSWTDIANKEVRLNTLKKYIELAHEKGMKTMFYNLAFGALEDAAADGVKEEWYLFKDANRKEKDKHVLPQPFFKSDIFLTDAGNGEWQNYLINQNKQVYQALDFDGYHVDALGDRGKLYNYNGEPVNQAEDFSSFLAAIKNAAPAKKMVMNAVNQYGQRESIALAPVDFLYTEVWHPNETYADIATILGNNYFLSDGKPTVLAAYMNYTLSDNPGYFNTPGLLLTDAVIFSLGGAHLELGEHILSKEYFPHTNLQVKDELRVALMKYYDFMVAYENLLRDGGEWNELAVVCTNQKMTINQWPPVSGNVSLLSKKVDNRQVLHLHNFNQATDLNWRDTNGQQRKPELVENAILRCMVNQKVTKVWVASPDHFQGAPQEISFVQEGNELVFTLPSLLYWNMIVIE